MTEPVIPGVLEGLPQVEQRSSVEIKENSKGEPVLGVKGYSNDLESLEATSAKVLETYKALRAGVAQA